MPLQFAWQDLRTDIFNSTQVMDIIEARPTCLGYVFSKIQATVEYYTQNFWLMQIDLCLELELGMGNYLRISLAEVWYQ